MGYIVSLQSHHAKAALKKRSLSVLFRDHPVVLVGDEIGALYLDHWATSSGDPNESVYDPDQDPFYPWNRRIKKEANIIYMELVYAAYDAGIRDIVLDMPPEMNPGIQNAMQIYKEEIKSKTQEIVQIAQLFSALACPMNVVVEMAAACDMRVHSMNVGLTGIATLFRHTKSISTILEQEHVKNRMSRYDEQFFDDDQRLLQHILRRKPHELETQTLHDCAAVLLNVKKRDYLDGFDRERLTARMIGEALDKKPFIGFFQLERLHRSPADLDGLMRRLYGSQNVARVLARPAPLEGCKKLPQYYLHYSIKECTCSQNPDCETIAFVPEVAADNIDSKIKPLFPTPQ